MTGCFLLAGCGSGGLGAGAPTTTSDTPPPPPDPCAGLVPAPGTPVEVALDVSDLPFCHRPTSADTGTAVVIGVGLHHMAFDVYPLTGGAPLGTIRVDHQDNGPIYDAIAATGLGFHASMGTGVESVADRGDFTAYDDHGAVLTTSPIHALVPDGTPTGTAGLLGDVRVMKPDPFGGGTVLLTISGTLMTPTARIEVVDAGGHRTAGTIVAGHDAWDIAVATDGHILAAGSEARWFDHDAQPLTEWFQVPAVPAQPAFSRTILAPLADGSIARRVGGTWTTRFPNGAPATEDVPAWLASRSGTEVWVIRGGKAHAVIGAPTQAYVGGGNALEILTASGRSCGKVNLPAATDLAQLDVGRDGTVFAFSVGASQKAGNQLCTYRWWPGLVR